MTTALLRYQCNVCGRLEANWRGQCEKCQHWDTLQPCAPTRGQDAEARVVTSLDPVRGAVVQRVPTGIAELDKVLNGGVVKGKSIVLSGDPGAGKSTLSVQLAGALAKSRKVLYVCGEESIGAVVGRVKRVNAAHENLLLTAAVEVSDLRAVIEEQNPRAVVFDSANTLLDASTRGEPGEPNQLKRVIKVLGPWCNARNLVSLFVAHVNKRGRISGPQFFTHMVDVVLHLHVNEKTGLRELKSKKNRDGSTDYVGRFKMAADGLQPGGVNRR